MRLFFAAYLSPENMRAYQAFVDHLIAEVPGTLRSVPPQTHHLTLVFLGEVAEDDVAACTAALTGLRGVESFEYKLGPPALLMGRGRPRLVHASVTENIEAIAEIQARLISGTALAGSSIDTRPKPPHVTLARFKKNAPRWQARRLRLALERAGSSSLPETDRLASVRLVMSSLTPSGPNYETLRELRL